MARFSRLRLSCLHRSARLLLLAAGFGGISAAPAWSCLGAQEFNTRSDIVTTSQAVAVDAYVSGFKTLIGESAAQQFNSRPLLTNGSTLAQAILKHNARLGTNLLLTSEQIAEAAGMQAASQLQKIAAPTPVVQHYGGRDGFVRIGIDFDFAITAEEIQTPPVELPTFAFTTHSERIHYWSLMAHLSAFETVQTFYPEATLLGGIKRIPQIIINEDEESLLGVAAEALETVIQPLLEEPGFLAISDAAPLDNPPAETNLAEYMPHMPGGDDAPTENPELEASAALVVSPTMAPDEYLAAFQDRIAAQQKTNSQQETNSQEDSSGEQQQSGQVVPVAHHEMIQVSDSPVLRALGGPISVTPSESETCRGFTIQFAPFAQPAFMAETQVFDGPAQIKLCDRSGSGSSVAEPAAHEDSLNKESLDEIASRMQRDFLARAVSGQIQIPAACPANNQAACAAAACQQAACPTAACPTDKTSAAPCGSDDCPGCPVGSSCCTAPLSGPPAHARSQWTLPTPVVTYNPYAQPPVSCYPTPAPTMISPRNPEWAEALGVYAPRPLEMSACPLGPSPTTFAAPPQMVYQPQPVRPEYPPASFPAQRTYPSTAPAARLPISPESLDTHREISRTLDQLAERCESQGMYDKADQLRELARENRMSARAIHGHLSALPMPQPYAVPAGYYPEHGPMLLPPSVNPPMNPTPPPALPIAQPIMVPRY